MINMFSAAFKALTLALLQSQTKRSYGGGYSIIRSRLQYVI